MTLQPRSVVYFGLYEAREAPGVVKKVSGTLRAASVAGFRTRSWSMPFRGVSPLAHLHREVLKSRESHLILRSLGWANLFLLPALCVARLRGQWVTVDVPTPARAGVRELWRSGQSLWRRARTVVLTFVTGPWVLWPASRIIQYADEGWWFSLGNRGRTRKLGNGVDVSQVAQRASSPPWPAPVLHLIGVGTLVDWHGYDRVIRAVHAFHQRPSRPFDAHFTIVGDGPSHDALVTLTRALGVERHVTFAGHLTGPELEACYERAHLAVSALAIHRKGLHDAAALKAREYCAVGIPFIASGSDVDFDPELPFRIEVESCDDVESIVDAFEAFGVLRPLFSDDDVRRFARERLDFRHKFPAMVT